MRHRATLVPLIEHVVAGRTQRDWLAALEAAGVPCGPINKLDAVFADPQVIAREMRIDLPHPLAAACRRSDRRSRCREHRSPRTQRRRCWPNTRSACCASAWGSRPPPSTVSRTAGVVGLCAP